MKPLHAAPLRSCETGAWGSPRRAGTGGPLHPASRIHQVGEAFATALVSLRVAMHELSRGIHDVRAPGKRYLDWQIDDPAGQRIEVVRTICDELDRRVQVLLSEVLVA